MTIEGGGDDNNFEVRRELNPDSVDQSVAPALQDVRVPELLRELPYWCLWRYEQFAGETKPRKMPYWADGTRRHGTQGAPADLERLTTFAEARDAAVRGGYEGVGFAHTAAGGIITLDFDNCVTDGVVREDVLGLVGMTYAEFSPSGKGIHAIFTGAPELVGNSKAFADGDDFSVEAFSTVGFTTFTGWMLDHVELTHGPDHIAPIPEAVVAACRHRFGASSAPAADPDDFLAGREPRLGLSIDEMQGLLSYLDPSMGRDPWLRVGMALHHETEGGDDGFEIWDEWSQGGHNYPNTEALRYQWDSFKPKPGRRQITMASVIRMAKGAGYKDPRAVNPAKRAGSFRFVPVGELHYRAPEFLVEGLIETDTLGLIFGDPGSAKSFLAVDLALCVATGRPFHDREVKQGPVFYVAGEGHNGLTRRFAAWSKHKGVSIEGAPLFVSNRPAQFLDEASAGEVVAAVHDLAGQHGIPALIVIDTLARNFGPGDENSTAEMSQFVAVIDQLRAEFPGTTVEIIHHTGHATKERARGAMALKAALDSEFKVEKTEMIVRLTNTKMKDAEPPAPIAFKLEGVDLGDGASSAVLVETEVSKRQRPLSKSLVLAIDAFVEAALGSSTVAGVHRDAWQTAFLARKEGGDDEAAKRAFRRARGDLLERGMISAADEMYRAECPNIISAIGQGRTERT